MNYSVKICPEKIQRTAEHSAKKAALIGNDERCWARIFIGTFCRPMHASKNRYRNQIESIATQRINICPRIAFKGVDCMPAVDMPLEELYKYQGRNECPQDFDKYWEQGLREMEALGTQCELIPAEFQVDHVKCYELYFTGVGNARIHGRIAIPEAKYKVPAVCLFHGYRRSCGSFAPLLSWAASGFAAAALSCRGQGGQSQDTLVIQGNTQHGHIIRGLSDPDPKKLYYRNVFLDTAQFARIIMSLEQIDAARVGAAGGSQGGGLTLACAALTPDLNRAAPMMPFLSDYRRVWEMDLTVNAYEELREHFRYFDPRHEHETEAFSKLGYIDVHHLAPRIKAEVKMFTGLMDSICPPSTQFAAYNRIQSKKSLVLYPDFGHEDYPGADDLCIQFMNEMK